MDYLIRFCLAVLFVATGCDAFHGEGRVVEYEVLVREQATAAVHYRMPGGHFMHVAAADFRQSFRAAPGDSLYLMARSISPDDFAILVSVDGEPISVGNVESNEVSKTFRGVVPD